MGKIAMGIRIRKKDLVVSGPNYSVQTLDEQQYFALRNAGEDLSQFVPLPAGKHQWYNAYYQGEFVLAIEEPSEAFIICDDAKQGYTMFHYDDDPDNPGMYRYSLTLPTRKLQTERSNNNMPNMLANLASAAGANRGLNSMNLGGEVPMQTMGDGVSAITNTRIIQREALAKSYVLGYVMGAAPAMSCVLARHKVKGQDDTFDINAKQSKPTRPLGVFMCLPARCVKRSGSLASPSEILAGQVDYSTTNPDEVVKQCFGIEAAIGYIYALGERIPEFAPTVSDAKAQWSQEAILAGAPGVSYVKLVASENKSRTSSVQSGFKFALRTTSPRRSLYTEDNIICLRALEHMPVKANTPEEAYAVNESAFGGWRHRHPKTATKDMLSQAISECPSQIWRKKYDINGKEVNGIGSAFFMNGASDTNESGEQVLRHQLMYFPWYLSSNKKDAMPAEMKEIVKRTLRPAEGDKKERMITTPILWKEQPNHPMFRRYSKFVDRVLNEGYIREDKLKSMGGRAAKANRKDKSLTNEQVSALKQHLLTDEVMASIQAVQDESSDRAILQH